MKASQLFAGTQNDGEPPRVQVRPPDLNSLKDTVRGQEPEPNGVGSQRRQPASPIATTPSAIDSRPLPANPAQPSPPCIYSWEAAFPIRRRCTRLFRLRTPQASRHFRRCLRPPCIRINRLTPPAISRFSPLPR